MSTLVWHVTMSLDGFIAGPDDAMDWAAASWGTTATTFGDRAPSRIADEVVASTGAVLAGRRWYDVATQRHNGVDGIYGGDWRGPVVVLTHRAPEGPHHPAIRFVTDGLHAAVDAALEAAGGKDVVLFGASIPRQCLQEGLLDDIVIHLAPVLLGSGTRLFEAAHGVPVRLTRTATAETGQLLDLRFQARR